MAGTAANAASWANADVFIAPLGSTGPTDIETAWAAAWKPVGLLRGEAGFTEARDKETSEEYAWGGLLVKRIKSKHKRTLRFVALEDNETVFNLVNPGSTRTVAAGLTTDVVKVPTDDEFMIGFELRDGDKVKRRYAERASVEDIAEIKQAETEITAYDVTVLVYPEDDATLYRDLSGTLA